MHSPTLGRESSITERLDRPHYPHPPIVEALIDIQVSFDAQPSLESLASLGKNLESEYPTRDNLYSLLIKADAEAGTAETTQSLVGYRYWTAKRNAVVQVRMNGISYSKIPSSSHPYDKWESSFETARSLWKSYSERLRPSAVKRLAVRYINRLDFADASVRLDDYFTARPDLPEAIPLATQAFVMRLEVAIPRLKNAKLVLNQGTVPPTHPNGLSVMLDLDVSQQVSLDPGNDELDMWRCLEQLHDEEYTLFNTFFTAKAKELFQ